MRETTRRRGRSGAAALVPMSIVRRGVLRNPLPKVWLGLGPRALMLCPAYGIDEANLNAFLDAVADLG